jgi:D-alanyl-D-alanine carboxypeptidase
MSRTSAIGAAMIAMITAVLVTACSSDTASNATSQQTTLTLTTTSVSTTQNPSIVEAVQALLDSWAAGGPGGVAVAVAGDDDELTVAAAGTAGPDRVGLDPGSPFRVGSLSKTFVAVMVLQLVAEGRVGLDDPVTAHAPNLTIADGVSIRQLLAHRTGIPEYTDTELFPAVVADPSKSWTPADVLALVADQPREFAPDERFAYSNTNYIVAGLLLEAVTGITLAENLLSRIVEPLGLTSTYFAPDDNRSPVGGFSRLLTGGDTSGSSYVALETSAGAAGALVSNAADLARFIRALASGELLPDDIYAEMTSGLPADGRTLGVFPAYPPSTSGISNTGSIPGFVAFMQYDPATQDLLVLLLNDDGRSPDDLGDALFQIAGAP